MPPRPGLGCEHGEWKVKEGATTMVAALNYLSRMTDAIFATQMERAAQKIAERERYFHRDAA